MSPGPEQERPVADRNQRLLDDGQRRSLRPRCALLAQRAIASKLTVLTTMIAASMTRVVTKPSASPRAGA